MIHTHLVTLVLAALLFAVAAVDIRTMRIPNLLNAAVIAAGLAASWALDKSLTDALVGVVLGYVLLFAANLAYRAWRGEGLAETARRLRVERAALLLRGSDAPLADIALAAGFCDQSHMNRAFRAVLDRTPLDVRLETALLQPLAT